MRTFVSTLMFPLLVIPSAAFAQTNDVAGRWASDGSIIEVIVEGNTLTARVIALHEPLYTAEEEGVPVGQPRLDHLNPDETLRDRPVQGLEILEDYVFDDRRWSGKIYDPESGNTYSSRMRVDDDGNLAMRGYIGIPMFGRTAVFTPIARCEPRIIELLRKAGLHGCELPANPAPHVQ